MEEMPDLEMDRYYIEEAMHHEEEMMSERAMQRAEKEEPMST